MTEADGSRDSGDDGSAVGTTAGTADDATSDATDNAFVDGITTRREVLAALGGAAVFSSTTETTTTSVTEGPVHLRVYPGALPTTGWARYGWQGVSSGWPPPYEDALEAIRDAFDQVTAYAADQGRLQDVEVIVERGGQVDLSLASGSSPRDAVAPTQQGVLDAFSEVLEQRGAVTGRCSHLLCWWGPVHYAIGYGGTRQPNRHVDAVEDEDAQVIANLGATETWDSRDVTKNIAIHEAFHTFLTGDVVETVIDSRCEHDLGTAVRVDEDTLEVSPMATAYAGPDEVGGGTRFHGTACYDHDSFYRHDGYDGVENWRYTTSVSEATLEAVTTYVERYLLEEG
ncbi:hypothetical protein [Natronosalvus rutilus]|uniref:Uncharacterized protein n=1 Tax=Natronosalvus rutilus TaxID=2953753 RepID=A0A9E7NBJ1_9EURY|nr:hypothetical protein [Natronosalvus rutilus]UTF54366.1 hypothetical protein NGM29_03540 [Natronosalvus rutilus]